MLLEYRMETGLVLLLTQSKSTLSNAYCRIKLMRLSLNVFGFSLVLTTSLKTFWVGPVFGQDFPALISCFYIMARTRIVKSPPSNGDDRLECRVLLLEVGELGEQP